MNLVHPRPTVGGLSNDGRFRTARSIVWTKVSDRRGRRYYKCTREPSRESKIPGPRSAHQGFRRTTKRKRVLRGSGSLFTWEPLEETIGSLGLTNVSNPEEVGKRVRMDR